MASINYPTSSSVSGAWLISSDNLIELDELLDSFTDRLAKEQERYIEQVADEKVAAQMAQEAATPQDKLDELRTFYKDSYRRRFDDTRSRVVTFFLSRGRTVIDEKFSGAIRNPHVGSEAPTGFSMFFREGEVTAKVKVRSLSYSNDLEFSVEPSNSEIAQEIFGALQNWVSDLEIPRWVHVARKWRFGIRFALLWWLLMAFLIPLMHVNDSPTEAYKDEARELLKRGVTPQDQVHAMELLLAISSEYHPANRRSNLGFRFWTIYLTGGAVLGALAISPSVVIGVWGGKNKLRFWRWWLRFIGVTIPMLIFTSIFWKKLVSLLAP